MPNRLAHETSPYLLQHQHNPVDWYAWCDEAFRRAKEESKPIFLSIGYSACHWCHVMERESFEDEAVAAILNAHFIAIKVDREERPDIDRYYQEVYTLMNGKAGGWPTSIFLTSELKPFYSATYLPPEDRYGLMGFGKLLGLIVDKYSQEFDLLDSKAQEVLKFLNNQAQSIQATKLDKSLIDKAIAHAKEIHDDLNGGFGKAPKFPQVSIINLVLDLYLISQDKQLLDIANFTLTKMTQGGLYDLVDGGFCRYSTDEKWLVPHFEKMLYDNALICDLLLKAYCIDGNTNFKAIAFRSLDFMIEKMSQSHLFYAASDADTDGEEGKYFVYSYDEARQAFEQNALPKALLEYLGITPQGNFEGHTIIRLAQEIPASYAQDIPKALALLKDLRQSREYPFIDTKILVSWNAMMIKTLFKAGRIEERYNQQAQASLKALIELLMVNGVLYHSTIIGHTPKIEAFLEDFAYLGDALIEAYCSTQNEIYLVEATRLLNNAIEKYYNQGKWKFSSGEFETFADIYDSSYPSSVGVMSHFILSISSLVDSVYKKFAFKSFELHSYKIMRQPLSSPKLTHAVIRYLVDDIIIKADAKAIQTHLKAIDTLKKPFVLTKVDTHEGFMACSSYSCFAHKESFEELVEAIRSL
ncbi:MAG: hypothetical protein KU38_04195 [Sulfurovum sp. FS08-3]|nr:MAG: hypothetical protein KU38_04195 [Sulfurovum sp. FS08-3]